MDRSIGVLTHMSMEPGVSIFLLPGVGIVDADNKVSIFATKAN